MRKIKQINIRNKTYYFYDDMINVKDFDIAIYYIGYITKKDEYKINSVNPLYLLIHEIDGFIEEIEGIKYLNIAFTDSNSEVLKKVCRNLEEN